MNAFETNDAPALREVSAFLRGVGASGRTVPRVSAPSKRSSSGLGSGSAGIEAVMACIRGAESGNYAESSHPSSGSGAYQYVPSTWETWSSRAGYSGYDYAYEAPAAVQDAVTVYVLTHGGAHNWDPRYGPDDCTVGMP